MCFAHAVVRGVMVGIDATGSPEEALSFFVGDV